MISTCGCARTGASRTICCARVRTSLVASQDVVEPEPRPPAPPYVSSTFDVPECRIIQDDGPREIHLYCPVQPDNVETVDVAERHEG